MPMDPQFLAGMSLPDRACRVGERDAMLYALSIGLGEREAELPFVYEGAGLRCFATMPLVLGDPGPWWLDPRTGLGGKGPLHGEQSLEILRPIPLETPLVARNSLVGLRQSGAGHAVITVERVLRRADDEACLAVGRASLVFRDAGDCGGFGLGMAPPPPPPQAIAYDSAEMAIGATSALLYRLNGDRNALHVDPAAARLAGFPAPILHGLLTMGMAAVALHRQALPSPLRAMRLRFSAPVYPADRITIHHAREGANQWFHARVGDRTVLDRGHAVLDLV